MSNRFQAFTRHGDTVGLSQFQQGYIEAALWSTGPFEFPPFADSDAPDSDRKTRDAEFCDLAPSAVEKMKADAARFEEENAAHIADCGESDRNCGRNFWLARSGSGCGWLDDDDNDALEALDAATDAFKGPFELYVGDDGKIYSDGCGSNA